MPRIIVPNTKTLRPKSAIKRAVANAKSHLESLLENGTIELLGEGRVRVSTEDGVEIFDLDEIELLGGEIVVSPHHGSRHKRARKVVKHLRP